MKSSPLRRSSDSSRNSRSFQGLRMNLALRWLSPALLLLSIPLGARLLAAPANQTAPTAPRKLSLPASVEPFERVELHARAVGYVVEVRGERGDVVTAGQVLARVDAPDVHAALALAKAELLERGQLVAAARLGVANAEAALFVARSQATRWEAEAQLHTKTLERQRILREQGAITAQELDEAESAAQVASAELEIARAKTRLAQTELDVAGGKLAVAQAQLPVAEAKVAAAEANVAFLELRAPFVGVIVERRVSTGDLARGGGTPGGMFTLQRVDTVRITFDVPERDAASVKRGMAAEIRVPGAMPRVVAATVTRTSGALDGRSRTLRTEIELSNSGGEWLVGSFVDVTLTLAGETK